MNKDLSKRSAKERWDVFDCQQGLPGGELHLQKDQHSDGCLMRAMVPSICRLPLKYVAAGFAAGGGDVPRAK